MAKNKKRKQNNYDYNEYEDRYDLRKTTKRKSKQGRKKDKKYLRDMLDGDIDKDAYQEYNDNKQ